MSNNVRILGQAQPITLDPNIIELNRPNFTRSNGGTVQRIQRTLALERRWTIAGKGPGETKYHGFFHAGGQSFPGKATVSNSAIDVYVRDVPPGLKRHPEWQCFRPRKEGWYWVHHTRNASLDAAILEIEAILTESLNYDVRTGRKSSNSKHHRSQPASIVSRVIQFLCS